MKDLSDGNNFEEIGGRDDISLRRGSSSVRGNAINTAV